MNKKVKWGLTAVIGCGLIAWGIYSQLPKLNPELEQAEKAAANNKSSKSNVLNVNGLRVKTSMTMQDKTGGDLNKFYERAEGQDQQAD